MRYGFTTGSCAAAASKAAAYMLLTGKVKNKIKIETPKGIDYETEVCDIKRNENKVSCAVKKDGGDDPDITSGALVYAEVSYAEVSYAEIYYEEISDDDGSDKVRIDGGVGVGRVTKPGLDQPVGNAAINHVPRQMIEKEVKEVCELCGYTGGLQIIISVPEGVELAKQTFNPRLGIVGGISILGTTGIVEPMSTKALLDTIKVELNQKKAEGKSIAMVSPGNYGLDYMKKAYDYDLDLSVKCSNFIGETIDMAVELGFEKMLLTGHIGKLIKVSGGIMNTHSAEGDCRMELLVSAAVKCGVDLGTLQEMLECVTTEDAISKISEDEQLLHRVMDTIVDKIHFYLNKRGKGKINVECIVYSNVYGELGRTENAEEYLKEGAK